MKLRIGLVAVLLIGLSVTTAADNRSDAKVQTAWGVQIAMKGLWRDAILRWEAATVLNPESASAWNNLAVGYEQQGRWGEAKKAYERAKELSKNDEHINSNYIQFREVYDRQNRASGK